MAASTSGLCAEGKPLAGGARFQEGWAVGGLVRNQPPAETKSEPKLVEVPCGASADAGSIPAASTSSSARLPRPPLYARREASVRAQRLAQRGHELALDHVEEQTRDGVLPVEESDRLVRPRSRPEALTTLRDRRHLRSLPIRDREGPPACRPCARRVAASTARRRFSRRLLSRRRLSERSAATGPGRAPIVHA